jgi:two-component system CheB/CheR fusion protein
MVSHELKQPLSVLLLNLGRLLEKVAEPDIRGAQELGQAMGHSIRRQARIIDDLFDLSRMRIGKLRLDPEAVDLGGMVRAVVADAAVRAPGRDLRVDVDASRRHVCVADPARLEQMLSNLLDNAVKFTGQGGCIMVRVASGNGFVRVSVTDDGCGISAEFLPHVFRMFGQEMSGNHAAPQGMGIGLALVHELANAHGGRVEAQSEGPGRGASFTLWLPIPDCVADTLPVAPRSAKARSVSSLGS